jgi:hypothetical protein
MTKQLIDEIHDELRREAKRKNGKKIKPIRRTSKKPTFRQRMTAKYGELPPKGTKSP